MRRLLGPLLLCSVLGAGLLTGCGGDDESATATDPESSTSTTSPSPGEAPPGTATDLPTTAPTRQPPITPSTSPQSGVEHTLVALESATAAGGRADSTAVAVGPGGDTGAVLGQLTDASFREVVEQQITFSRATGDLYAAIVSVGCDTPPGVVVAEVGGGYTITAQKVADPLPNCFAPVTTVAVVAIP